MRYDEKRGSSHRRMSRSFVDAKNRYYPTHQGIDSDENEPTSEESYRRDRQVAYSRRDEDNRRSDSSYVQRGSGTRTLRETSDEYTSPSDVVYRRERSQDIDYRRREKSNSRRRESPYRRREESDTPLEEDSGENSQLSESSRRMDQRDEVRDHRTKADRRQESYETRTRAGRKTRNRDSGDKWDQYAEIYEEVFSGGSVSKSRSSSQSSGSYSSEDDDDFQMNANCMNTLFNAKDSEMAKNIIRCQKTGPSASELQLKMTLPLPLQFIDNLDKIVPTKSGLESAIESLRFKSGKIAKNCDFDYSKLEEQVIIDEEFPGGVMPQFYKSLFEDHTDVSSEEASYLDEKPGIAYSKSRKSELTLSPGKRRLVSGEENLTRSPSAQRLPSHIIVDEEGTCVSSGPTEPFENEWEEQHQGSSFQKDSKLANYRRLEGVQHSPRTLDLRRKRGVNTELLIPSNAAQSEIDSRHEESFHARSQNRIDYQVDSTHQMRDGIEKFRLQHSDLLPPRFETDNTYNDHIELERPSFDEGRVPRLSTSGGRQAPQFPQHSSHKTQGRERNALSKFNKSLSAQSGFKKWIPAEKQQLDLVDQAYPSFDAPDDEVAKPSAAVSIRNQKRSGDLEIQRCEAGIPISISYGDGPGEHDIRAVYSDLTGDITDPTKEYPVIRKISPSKPTELDEMDPGRIIQKHSENPSKKAPTVLTAPTERLAFPLEQEDELMGSSDTPPSDSGDEIMGPTKRSPSVCAVDVLNTPTMKKIPPSPVRTRELEAEILTDKVASRTWARPDFSEDELMTRPREQIDGASTDKTPKQPEVQGGLRNQNSRSEDLTKGRNDQLGEPSSRPSLSVKSVDLSQPGSVTVESTQVRNEELVHEKQDELIRSSSKFSDTGVEPRTSNNPTVGKESPVSLDNIKGPAVVETVTSAEVPPDEGLESKASHRISSPTQTHASSSQPTSSDELKVTVSSETKVANNCEVTSPIESKNKAAESTVKASIDENANKNQAEVTNHTSEMVDFGSRQKNAAAARLVAMDGKVEHVAPTIAGQKNTSAQEVTPQNTKPPLQVENPPGDVKSSQDEAVVDNASAKAEDISPKQKEPEKDTDKGEKPKAVDVEKVQPDLTMSMGNVISSYTLESFAQYCKKLDEQDDDTEPVEPASRDEIEESVHRLSQIGEDDEETRTDSGHSVEESARANMMSEIDAGSQAVEVNYVGYPGSGLSVAPSVATTQPPIVIAPTTTTLETKLTSAHTTYTMDTPMVAPPGGTFDTYDRSSNSWMNSKLDKSSGNGNDFYQTDIDGDTTTEGEYQFDERFAKLSALLPASNCREDTSATTRIVLPHTKLAQMVSQSLFAIYIFLMEWIRYVTRAGRSTRRGGSPAEPKFRKIQANRLVHPTWSQMIQGNSSAQRNRAVVENGSGVSVEPFVPNVQVSSSCSVAPMPSNSKSWRPLAVSQTFASIRQSCSRSDARSVASMQGWSAKPNAYETEFHEE